MDIQTKAQYSKNINAPIVELSSDAAIWILITAPDVEQKWTRRKKMAKIIIEYSEQYKTEIPVTYAAARAVET